MGQSKGGAADYNKLPTVTPEIAQFLKSMTGSAQQNQQLAADAWRSFLPGGEGAKPFVEQANKNFQQTTLPSILNAFGSGSKGSSSLNQALASGASDLNTNIASILAQSQLQAAQGLGGLGTSQAGIAVTPQFDYQQKRRPLWQDALLGGIGAGGQIGGGWLGRTVINNPAAPVT